MKKIYHLLLFLISVTAIGQSPASISDTIKPSPKDTTFLNTPSPNQFLNSLSVPSPGAAGLGKFVDIPVNFNNGLPQISIPIATVSEGNLQLPISLQYHTGGVRVSETASWVGLNWVLNAGGVISRQVRGGPDESWSGGNKGAVPATANYGTRTGYYQNNGYPTFPFITSSTSSTDRNIASDQILAATLGINDTEPDLFSYNVGGLTGRFFFDAQRKPHFIPQQDLTVEVTFNATAYQFDTFILTTSDGTRYYFGQNNAYEVSKTATGTSVLGNTPTFRSSWYLTQIESADRQKHIYLTYTPETTTFRNINSEKRIFCTSDNAYTGPASNERISTTQVDGQRLLRIYSSQQDVNFGANTIREDVEGGSKRLDQIDVSAFGDANSCLRFSLSYDYLQSTAASSGGVTLGGDAGTADMKRLRLLSVQEKSCDNSLTKPAYSFEYETTALPRRLSYQRDHWGFYNGQDQNNSLIPADQASTTLTIGNRTPNWTFMKAAHLQKITYPTGGYTLFTFEPHYEANPLNYKGGLRIQKIDDFAATGAAETRTFTYSSPFEPFPATAYRRNINQSAWGTFVQSGLPLTGALTTFNASCLENSPNLIGSDLYSDIASMGGSAIAYSRVSVARAGGGRSDYYYLAAGYTSVFGSISAGIYPIPATSGLYYAVNGKLEREEHFNESGQIQRKTEYSYQSLTGAAALTNAPAIQFVQDVCPLCAQVNGLSTTSVAFTAYNLYEYRLLLLEKKDYQYNYDGTQAMAVPTRYRYAPNHNQVIRTATVDSKGDSLIQVSRYVLDYDLSGSLTGTAAVLKTMKDRNQNAEIERLTYLKKSTETDATMLATGGSITKYAQFSVGSPTFQACLPSAVLTLKTPDRVSVTPSSISGDLVFNTNYEQRATFGYNTMAELSDEQLEHGPTTHYDYYTNHLLNKVTQAYGSPQAQITTYIHNALFGLTKSTDPRGVNTAYAYDALGRLQNVKDHQNNLLQVYEYGYAPNVVKHYMLRVAATSLPADYSQRVAQFAYADGLGRPLQTVLYRAGGDASKDIVTNAQTYDAIGRPKRTYLPFANAGSGAIAALPASVQGDNYPYSENQDFDGSPLNRIRTVYGPGQAWRTAGRLTDLQYGVAGSQARRYDLTSSGAGSTGGYADNTLTENVTIDEQGHYTAVYTDKQGRVVQRSTQKDVNVTANGTFPTFYYTAYVYDDLGRLRYVIPPKAHEIQTSFDENSDYFREGVYAYRYDQRGRVIEKQLPGAGWTHIVYDVLDRPVLTQDAKERSSNQWQFTQYDILGRVVRTGILTLTNSDTRTTLQAAFDAITTPYETGGTLITARQSASFPFSITVSDVQTENYYDTYGTWRPANQAYVAQSGYGSDFGNATGLLTGKQVRYLENNSFLASSFYYDDKARVVQSYQQNHVSGTDRVDNAYLHAGEIEKTQTTHSRSGASNQVTIHRYLYDHAGRRTKYFHSLNGTEKEVANYSYNDRGQLIQKKIQPTGTYQTSSNGITALARPANPTTITTDQATRQIELTNGTYISAAQTGNYLARIAPGGSSTTAALQTIDYDYHLRGWLTGINAPNGVASLNTAQNDLFALSLQYENDGTYFDGNLRKQLWVSSPVSASGKIAARQFTYSYNHANRLAQAQYTGGKENFSLDKAEYDANGNIKQLWQNGWLGGSSFGRMDELTFNFTNTAGNKLTHVSDAITGNTDAGDFRDRNTGTDDYEYWPNGDLKKDLNKDITLIDYNFLRLPKELTLTGSRWLKYYYTAGGQKARKLSSTGEVWDYVGEFIYKNNSLYQITHEEGRINNGKYEYNYTDHLGHLRLSFRDSLTAGAPPVITQENHYSPFGLSLKGVDFQPASPDNFKFSQNEQQNDFGINLYDFGARFSDPTTGNRFLQMDPLAEMSRRFSPYIYANSNPMRFIDPDGMSAQDVETYTTNDGTTVSYDVNTQKTLSYDTSTQEGEGNDKGKPNPLQSLLNWIDSFFQTSISMGGNTLEEVAENAQEYDSKETTFNAFATAVKNADEAQDIIFSFIPGAGSLKKTATGDYSGAVEAGVLDALTFGKLKVFTSSKSVDKLAQVYTIYDVEGKLFKFGVTDTKLKRLSESLLLAGPGATSKLTQVMTKPEAHLVEKYFRTLHYNSTGRWTIPGMRVPFPISFDTGKKLLRPIK